MKIKNHMTFNEYVSPQVDALEISSDAILCESKVDAYDSTLDDFTEINNPLFG